MIYIYSDGSSTGRSNREGGWGYVIVEDDTVLYADSGGSKSTTNNLMELEGAIQGFCYLINNKIFKPVTLITDSKYVEGIADGSFSPKKNKEQCELLRRLFKFFNKKASAKVEWVRGHSGNIYNEMADKLSKSGKESYIPNKRKKLNG